MKELLVATLVFLLVATGAAVGMFLFVRSLIVIGDAL